MTYSTHSFTSTPALPTTLLEDTLDNLLGLGGDCGGGNSADGSLTFTGYLPHSALANALTLAGAETLFSPTTEGTYYAYLDGTNYTLTLTNTTTHTDCDPA